MTPSPAKVAIVIAHGSLARGLVSAMEKVLGAQSDVFWLSNTGKSPTALQAAIEALIAREAPDKDVYLLTDLRGGSCASTALRTSRSEGVRGVFYGVNLSLLLEFVLHRELPSREFFEAVLGKARSSVDGQRFPCPDEIRGEGVGGPGGGESRSERDRDPSGAAAGM